MPAATSENATAAAFGPGGKTEDARERHAAGKAQCYGLLKERREGPQAQATGGTKAPDQDEAAGAVRKGLSARAGSRKDAVRQPGKRQEGRNGTARRRRGLRQGNRTPPDGTSPPKGWRDGAGGNTGPKCVQTSAFSLQADANGKHRSDAARAWSPFPILIDRKRL